MKNLSKKTISFKFLTIIFISVILALFLIFFGLKYISTIISLNVHKPQNINEFSNNSITLLPINSKFNSRLIANANISDYKFNNHILYPNNCSNAYTKLIKIKNKTRYLSSTTLTNKTILTNYMFIPVKSGEVEYVINCKI